MIHFSRQCDQCTNGIYKTVWPVQKWNIQMEYTRTLKTLRKTSRKQEKTPIYVVHPIPGLRPPNSHVPWHLFSFKTIYKFCNTSLPILLIGSPQRLSLLPEINAQLAATTAQTRASYNIKIISTCTLKSLLLRSYTSPICSTGTNRFEIEVILCQEKG